MIYFIPYELPSLNGGNCVNIKFDWKLEAVDNLKLMEKYTTCNGSQKIK